MAVHQSPFLLVAGARPNFMKVAPISRAMRKRNIKHQLLNTGQHHDPMLSDVFLKELGLGRPQYNLEVGSGTHAEVTARIMERVEPILQKLRPRAVVVVGDVNSTMAVSVTAAKLHIPIAHVEAGLRSHDWAMPEEINRILTDRASDLLLTPSPDADSNLQKEGTPKSKIVRVGNVMIDSLVVALKKGSSPKKSDPFLLMTFHRPSNVDSKEGLKCLIRFLTESAKLLPVLLPLHPRTKAQLHKFKLWKTISQIPGLRLLEPLSYFDFIQKMRGASAIVTDSGGIQEESSYLGIPCLIMRTTTERPVCITHGTSELMGENYNLALSRLKSILRRKRKKQKSIPLWDGKAADRIVSALTRKF
jgi:UDP-N-acetylglucosamine 2-epimerase (non-hydrolysing)